MAVVADEEHGAFEPRQRLDQHLLGGDVEMVGGLVQHEEVRRIVEHQRHDEARLLAAGEHAAALLDIVAGEAEAAGERPKRALVRLGEGILQGFEDGSFALENLHRMLGEIAELDAGAERDDAGIRLGGAGDELQERRLAGAVDAHDAPALAPADLEVEAVIDDLLAIALGDALQVRDIVPRAWRRLELELHGLSALRRLDALDLVELLDPALHLRGMGGARLEALDESDLLGQHRLLALELRLLLLFAERPLLLVEFVVAGIGRQRPAVDLDDLADDAVHEGAVVRGHQQRALVALQELLQPDQALDVEMVRRLVEQHGVRRHQQDAGQRDAHLPAAGEGADIALHHRRTEAEAGQHLAGAAVERIAVEGLEAPLHPAVAGDDLLHLVGAVGIGHGGFEHRELGRDARDRAGAVHHRRDDAHPRHLADILAEIADGGAAIDRDLALVGGLLAGDEAEQRGLAGAVGADEADLLALLQGGGSLDEDDLLAVLLADAFEPDHGCGEPKMSGTALGPRRPVRHLEHPSRRRCTAPRDEG